jgi:hypothetical protein
MRAKIEEVTLNLILSFAFRKKAASHYWLAAFHLSWLTVA